jgi:ankyrin repeat protein
LQISVEQAQLGTAHALLKHSADANARNLFGRSPLHDAVARGNSDLVALLLRYGADPGTADDNGTTPLHLAARGGSSVLVGALLSYGANPSARNLAGATPYDVAKQQDRTAILQQLANANPSRPGHAIAEAHGHADGTIQER